MLLAAQPTRTQLLEEKVTNGLLGLLLMVK